jgi:hypothetical protein
MFLHELLGGEEHPVYQALQVENTRRQYSFLISMVEASVALGRPFLSANFLKSLNFHAITCLHVTAGEYRPCRVTVGDYEPGPFFSVGALMDDFINEVNFYWQSANMLELAAYVLWKLNHIHPFINGNGRTARAACYFVVCAKSGGLLPGSPILPELLVRDRDEYVSCLQSVDDSARNGNFDLTCLIEMLRRLLTEQIGHDPTAAQAPN